MNTDKILIIDDEADIRELLIFTLRRMNISCDAAKSYEEAIDYINQNEYFLVLTDMKLPGASGHEIVRYIQKSKPQLPVAVITAYGNVEGAVSTLKAGAFDYVSKPINLDMLKNLIGTAHQMYKVEPKTPDLLIGESSAMVLLKEKIVKISRSLAPVFIFGASGVGKELVARLIHHYSARADKPFIAVNCAAIPGELMESEFFGHKKGSFTGAISDKQGLFEAASGGTLFLDEIAELPLVLQVKLLRAIQEKAVKPIGATAEIPFDVRILSASNKNLLEEIAHNRFRQELYYRINVIEIYVPSLVERKSDIVILANHILKKLNTSPIPVELTKDAIKALNDYDFPGNVRELENILERALTLSNDHKITSKELQLPTYTPKLNAINESNLDEALEQQQKEIILKALEDAKYNKTKAAKNLGISFRTLRYRLKKLGIE